MLGLAQDAVDAQPPPKDGPMVTTRETMSRGAVRAGTGDTLVQVARTLRDRRLDRLPVCDRSDALVALVTERDLVVGAMADGADPVTTHVRDLGLVAPVAVAADASAEEALGLMIEHATRRLPVVDHGQLVGTVTQTALAMALSEESIGNLIAEAGRSRDRSRS
jgi:CBS domain-containing protein